MRSVIVVHERFDRVWPFAADHFHRLWRAQGPVEFIRLEPGDGRNVADGLPDPGSVDRLVVLGVPAPVSALQQLSGLKEAAIQGQYGSGLDEKGAEYLKAAGVQLYNHPSEGYWAESVAEFGLALTLCGLRRIPQLHRAIIDSLEPWDYEPGGGIGRPGVRGLQFGDDPRFVSGTVAGKRVRIVGAGNIASRYASYVKAMGADVAAWDPYASEPCFHRAGSRREWHLDRLMQDADIFVPMVPLLNSTRGVVTVEHIDALPKGCLVVLATRALICNMQAIRRRVLADEIALAADVWDVEPLPLDDPLLGRHNVVHTPHNAGRTIFANQRYAEKLAERFRAVTNGD